MVHLQPPPSPQSSALTGRLPAVDFPGPDEGVRCFPALLGRRGRNPDMVGSPQKIRLRPNRLPGGWLHLAVGSSQCEQLRWSHTGLVRC